MDDWYDEVGAWMEGLSREEMQRLLSNWVEIAAQNQRNTDYYRGLVIECGKTIGEESYICNDGSISEDILCAKVPWLVKKLKEKHYDQ